MRFNIHSLLWALTFLVSACASTPTDRHGGAKSPAANEAVSQKTLDGIAAMPHGSRPDPSTYLPAAYIQHHLAQFDHGASYLTPKAALDRFGRDLLGRADGQFVMTAPQLDQVLRKSHGDLAVIEKELGIPAGSWQGQQFARIDVPNPRALHLRMATGNEAAANAEWLPGGKLPTGYLEAVTDPIPKGSYTETPLAEAVRRVESKTGP